MLGIGNVADLSLICNAENSGRRLLPYYYLFYTRLFRVQHHEYRLCLNMVVRFYTRDRIIPYFQTQSKQLEIPLSAKHLDELKNTVKHCIKKKKEKREENRKCHTAIGYIIPYYATPYTYHIVPYHTIPCHTLWIKSCAVIAYPSGTTRRFPQENFRESHRVNPLLTKLVRSRWLNICQVFFALPTTQPSYLFINFILNYTWPHTWSINHTYHAMPSHAQTVLHSFLKREGSGRARNNRVGYFVLLLECTTASYVLYNREDHSRGFFIYSIHFTMHSANTSNQTSFSRWVKVDQR